MERTKRSTGLVALVTLVLAACEPPPAAPVLPTPTALPPPPVAPPAPLPKRTAREIEIPVAPCVVEADAPKANAPVGIDHVFVGGVPIAHTSEMGAVKHARLVFSEARRSLATVEIDAEIVSIRGAAPLKTNTTDDITLYPRSHVVRDGWLEYDVVRVAAIDGDKLEPALEIPKWLTPEPSFSAAPFRVPCGELVPFADNRTSPPPDAEVTGRRIALEDTSGKKLATLDAEFRSEGPKKGTTVVHGQPAVVLEKKGNRSKLRFEIDSDAHAEGWVASRYVHATMWGGLGYGTGSGRGMKLATLSCDEDVPLWVTLREATFAVGTLHAKKTVRGVRTGDGDFRVVLGSGASLADTDTTKVAAADPFVPKERLEKCQETAPVEARK